MIEGYFWFNPHRCPYVKWQLCKRFLISSEKMIRIHSRNFCVLFFLQLQLIFIYMDCKWNLSIMRFLSIFIQLTKFIIFIYFFYINLCFEINQKIIFLLNFAEIYAIKDYLDFLSVSNRYSRIYLIKNKKFVRF